MSDEPVKVHEFKIETITWDDGTTFMGVTCVPPVTPGRYIYVEDVELLVREAWEDGHETSDEHMLGVTLEMLFKYSQTAARLRAIKGE